MDDVLTCRENQVYADLEDLCLQRFNDLQAGMDFGLYMRSRAALGKELEIIHYADFSEELIEVATFVSRVRAEGKNIILSNDGNGSFVVYLLGISQFNPMQFGCTPILWWGLRGEEGMNFSFHVPRGYGGRAKEILRSVNPEAHYSIRETPLLDYQTRNTAPLVEALARNVFFPDVLNREADQTRFGRIQFQVEARTVYDYVRVLNLYFGEGIWEGNMESALSQGILSPKQVITSAEEVYFYLSSHGIPEEIAYKLMKLIKDGRFVPAQYRNIMRGCGIEEGIIERLLKVEKLQTTARMACLLYSVLFACDEDGGGEFQKLLNAEG